MTSTEVAVANSAEIEAILAAQQAEDDAAEVAFHTPILKLCQSQTKEVKAGDAVAGEFLNTLTSESYGTKIEFVTSFFQRGRSVSVDSGGYRNTIGQDLIPDDPVWIEAVGEEFVGTRFDEHPDAEEVYKNRVNSGEIEWGKGPKISTTYNYTGLVLPLDGADEDAEPMPVRLSFLRSTKDAHTKLQTLKRTTMRNKAWWDVVFVMETVEKNFGRNTSFIVNVKKGRATEATEKGLAVELAQAVMAGRTQDNSSSESAADRQVAPDAEGGLGL